MKVRQGTMDSSEFRLRGKEMVDYIADYMDSISSRRVTSEVDPGYLRNKLPRNPPKSGESFSTIMEDVEKKIMPGAASPACTELETIVLDWFAKMIGLPRPFLHESGAGGGVIQGSASECVLVTLLAARYKALKELKNKFPLMEDGVLLSKLVAYSSKLAHSCVEKAGMLGYVKMRQLDVDENFALRGYVLERAIEEDRRLGLIPVYVCATLGTTACCSFDNIQEIGEVCARENVWLHIDAAYAGNALICPEFSHLIHGIENVTSINCNPNKWLLVNFDCSLMWIRNKELLTSSMTVDPLYLQHKHDDKTVDLRHWGIPLSRRFRSLKLWFVIRTYGTEGLQKYIRQHIRLAKLFETYVKNDARFEVMGKVTVGLVCFRLKGPNSLTAKLNHMINESGSLHMVPALINENYVIRFAICAQNAKEDDIEYAWRIIAKEASSLLSARMSIESILESEKDENLEEDISEADDDVFPVFDDDFIFDQQRSNLHRARIRRGLFMRMVSDPKCYNPRVLRALCVDKRRSRSVSSDETKDNPNDEQ